MASRPDLGRRGSGYAVGLSAPTFQAATSCAGQTHRGTLVVAPRSNKCGILMGERRWKHDVQQRGSPA
jgi:hypothetical protein